MKLRRKIKIIGLTVIVPVYLLCYVLLSHRDSGRARGAGEYFHYRDFAAAWEVYLFTPAALVEGWMIQAYPEPFLPSASWASLPQRLVIRVPDNSTQFWFPPNSPSVKMQARY